MSCMSFASFSENSLLQAYRDNIQPFWQHQVEQGHFAGVNSTRIHYAVARHPQPTGSLVISSGRVECLLKYKELVYDFYQQGYSVFIHDHRGQGLSGRITDNPQHGYVDDFAHYITDLKTFYRQTVAPQSEHKPVLLCHSMGGAIGTLYAHQYPDDFAKIAMSAPMYGIRPALPNWLASAVVGAHFLFRGDKPKYFWGQTDFSLEPFADNRLTNSSVRYQLMQREYQHNPQIQLGGVTGHWLAQAHQAMNEIANRASSFKLPALVLQAADDRIVDNIRQRQVVEKMPNAQFEIIPNAEHEILMEKDAARGRALARIMQFFIA